jgi:uncharacterized membrane protein
MKPIVRSAGIGALAAMRTFSAPACVARPESVWAKRFWLFAAAFEMVVFDKLPFVPARTTPSQLVGRVVSGAASAIYANRPGQGRVDRIAAGVTGGAVAAIGAYAAMSLRRGVGARLGLPDALIGVAEDGVSIGLGRLLVSSDSAGRRRADALPLAEA